MQQRIYDQTENTIVDMLTDDTFRDVAIYAVQHDITVQNAVEKLIRTGLNKKSAKNKTEDKRLQANKATSQLRIIRTGETSLRETILSALSTNPEHALSARDIFEKIRSGDEDRIATKRKQNYINGILSSLANKKIAFRFGRVGKYKYYLNDNVQIDKKPTNIYSKEDVELLTAIKLANELDEEVDFKKIKKLFGFENYSAKYYSVSSRLRKLSKNGLLNRTNRSETKRGYVYSLTKDGEEFLNQNPFPS